MVVDEYENALAVNEWLNGSNPKYYHRTIEEIFISMSDQQRLTLFNQRIHSDAPTLFDDWLRAWWMNRY